MDEDGLRQLIVRELYPKRCRQERWLARSAQAQMVCSNCRESGVECVILASRIHCRTCRHSDNICSRRTQELYEHIGSLEPDILRGVSRGDFDDLVNEVYRQEQLILSDSSAGEDEADDATRRTSEPKVVRIPRAPRPMPMTSKKRSAPTVEIPRPPASARIGVPIDVDDVDESSQCESPLRYISTSSGHLPTPNSTAVSDDTSELNFGAANPPSDHNHTQLKIAQKTLEVTQKNLGKEKEKTAALDNSNTRLKIEVKELKSERKNLLKRVDTLEKQIHALQAEGSRASRADNSEVLQEYMQINLERSKLAQAKEAVHGHPGCPLNEAVESHMKVLDSMAAKCFSKLPGGVGDMAGIRVVSDNSSSAGRAKGPPLAKRSRLE